MHPTEEETMIRRNVICVAAAGFLTLFAAGSMAADPQGRQEQEQTQVQEQEQIYGSQLMTREERMEHYTKMRSLKSEEERQAYRLEHHRKMQERAKELGMTLPDEPMTPGGGMGMGGGGGMGMGGGMGSGGGRGR
jgi:uncharacterized membrane protein